MKFKTLPLAILLLLLLTLTPYAQTPPGLQNAQSNIYGIEPEQLYQGTLLLELMEAAETEIDASVHEAYAAGYKAAMLHYAPDAAAYKTASETMKAELDAERRKNRWFWPAVGVSFVSGFLIHSLVGR